jgi:hypothetical protein
MTEREWLECADPGPMLRYLEKRGSERKLRLFACACCRLVWDLLDEPASRRAMLVAEQYADDLASREARLSAAAAAHAVADAAAADADARALDEYVARGTFGSADKFARRDALRAAAFAAEESLDVVSVAEATSEEAAAALAKLSTNWGDYYDGRRHHPLSLVQRLKFSREREADLLHCIFGNPFRPVSFDPAWQTPAALALARTAYEVRRFDDLPLLADALEEAGCTDATLLTHLRSDGPHARGCWALDLILGKS